jgi:transposase
VQLATRFDVHQNQLMQWKTQLLQRAADAFDGCGPVSESGPDIKDLHATIGQLALESDSLAGALGRLPGSSAKR